MNAVGFLVLFVLPALIILGLLLWGIKNPLAWLVVAVLAIAIGSGCAIYGLTILLANRDGSYGLTEAAMQLGGGCGAVLGGVVLLLLGLIRLRKSPTEKVAISAIPSGQAPPRITGS